MWWCGRTGWPTETVVSFIVATAQRLRAKGKDTRLCPAECDHCHIPEKFYVGRRDGASSPMAISALLQTLGRKPILIPHRRKRPASAWKLAARQSKYDFAVGSVPIRTVRSKVRRRFSFAATPRGSQKCLGKKSDVVSRNGSVSDRIPSPGALPGRGDHEKVGRVTR